jgi:hypothetical protein
MGDADIAAFRIPRLGRRHGILPACSRPGYRFAQNRAMEFKSKQAARSRLQHRHAAARAEMLAGDERRLGRTEKSHRRTLACAVTASA